MENVSPPQVAHVWNGSVDTDSTQVVARSVFDVTKRLPSEEVSSEPIPEVIVDSVTLEEVTKSPDSGQVVVYTEIIPFDVIVTVEREAGSVPDSGHVVVYIVVTPCEVNVTMER